MKNNRAGAASSGRPTPSPVSPPVRQRTGFAVRQGLLLLLLLCAVFLCFCGGLNRRAVAAADPEVPAAADPKYAAAPLMASAVRPFAEPLSAAALSKEDLRLQESLRISEAMPSNGATLFDEDGESSDWLEIVNIGDEAVSLENFRLSDKTRKPAKWLFPAIRLESGERLLIFCSKKDRIEGELHTNFSLSKVGGEIVLSSPSGLILDSVSYGEAKKDRSFVFYQDEDGELDEPRLTWQVTPGFPNSEKGYEAWVKASDRHGDLIISEAVSFNNSYPPQQLKYYDWVELENTGEEALDLSDYYLSDDDDDLRKSRLPERLLQPGERIVFFCSGDPGLSKGVYQHLGFAIGTDEHLWLSDRSGTISDCLWVHDIPTGRSIGRVPDCSGAFYFAEPTPGKENGTGFRFLTETPVSLTAQGVYNDVRSLSVELSGPGEIYYSLDGSIPDSADTLYEEPIRITDTTVLRAVCAEEGKLTGQPATFHFILNEDDSLPVTSLVADPKEMFGAGGVYTAIQNRNARCDAQVAFFEEGGEGFSAGCSVELHGANSRNTFRKKSFELKFLSRTGGSVSYDLFGDGEVTEFSSLLLRGGSNVNLDTVRDCFASELIEDVYPTLYPQKVRYTAVYINGTYYGIYAWREAYSEDYFASHTGADPAGVTMARAPLSAGELYDLFNYAATHPHPSDEEYEYMAERLDLDSLAGWMLLQAWFNNLDINGNIRYVKLSEYAPWQMVLYDLDYSLLTDAAGWDVMMNSYQINIVMRSLLSRTEFCDLLLQKAAEMTEKGFTTEHILEVFDELLEPLDEATVKKDLEAWSEDYGKWLHNLDAVRSHLTDARMAHWLQGLQSLTHATEEDMHRLFPEYY